MITIVAKVEVKPGKKGEFIQRVAAMIDGSRAEEGNISYNLFEDLERENRVAFIEQWKDLEAIDFHNNTTHFQSGLKVIKELSETVEITKYQPVE